MAHDLVVHGLGAGAGGRGGQRGRQALLVGRLAAGEALAAAAAFGGALHGHEHDVAGGALLGERQPAVLHQHDLQDNGMG